MIVQPVGCTATPVATATTTGGANTNVSQQSVDHSVRLVLRTCVLQIELGLTRALLLQASLFESMKSISSYAEIEMMSEVFR
jgi:hypothetical protein